MLWAVGAGFGAVGKGGRPGPRFPTNGEAPDGAGLEERRRPDPAPPIAVRPAIVCKMWCFGCGWGVCASIVGGDLFLFFYLANSTQSDFRNLKIPLHLSLNSKVHKYQKYELGCY